MISSEQVKGIRYDQSAGFLAGEAGRSFLEIKKEMEENDEINEDQVF
jgi:hypothetical protein